jgi:serine/threonine protein kinase
VSSEGKDLISKMLCSPSQRINCKEILEHPWMQEKSLVANLSLNRGVLKKFIESNKLKKVMDLN